MATIENLFVHSGTQPTLKWLNESDIADHVIFHEKEKRAVDKKE